MKRVQETVWIMDEKSRGGLLKHDGCGRYQVVPALCSAEILAELGKAIVDALAATAEGGDLLEYAMDRAERIAQEAIT